MARFSGNVGFGTDVESRPGVWRKEITERPYFGDVKRADRMRTQEDSVNAEIRVNNEIRIVADAFATENVFAIEYVVWAGQRWTVSHAEIQRPRLILQLGEVYHGESST